MATNFNNLFGSSGMSDLFNSKPVEPSKDITDMLANPVNPTAISESAKQMAAQQAQAIQEGISAGQRAAAEAQARYEAMQRQTQANMEAVLRMQEERKKAEEEARKKAEEAKKEQEKSIDEDPESFIRADLDAVLNSEVYKNAGDKQKRDLLAEAAKQYEADLTAQGLDSKYVKKLVESFKINGERDVVEYINKSEKDDWDIVNDLIVPVKGAIDRSRAAWNTKDARIIDQAIADLKAGKEVSGWAVDEILDRDPSLRKYLDVTSGAYSSLTQGVGSSFKLKQGVESEFTTAANKTWNTAIDKAVALEKNAKEIDANRSADAQRHWKNYDYEAAKIDNAEKAGQISSFDSFLSHGMLFLSNPTVPLDKAAPSMIKGLGEVLVLDRTVNAMTAAGAGIGVWVGGAGAVPGAVAGRIVGTTIAVAKRAIPFLASAVVSGKATEEEIINNARETISALDVNNKDDLKTLQAMPGWSEMLARSDNNPELAKLRMSAFASEDAAFAGAITGAIAGLVGPEAFLARGATKLIVRSTLSKPATVAATVGKTAGAAALSSASEGAEEAMTQYLSNYASIYSSDDGRGLTSHLKATWGEAPLMEGVANAAAQGMGVGLIAGGAGGAMGFRSDLADTEKAISQQRVKNEVNFIKNGVENLTAEVDTLLASGKVDQKVLTETLLSGFRTQTKELSATASKYSYRDEQQGKQMVYDHIIEPVLERSGVTTEQAAEVVRKINTAFPEVNTNAYAQATDTAFIKALKADTLEQAEAIYGKPLSTLRADTWRVYNNKDTGSVTDLDQAQAAATLVRSVLSEGDVLTVQRAGAVLRTMYGYRNADNKLVDGIIHKHPNLSDSQLDAVLELAKTELDAYNRRETNEERQAREQGEQARQQPNDGGVPRDGGNGGVAVGTPSQGQDQADQETNLGGLGGQEQGGQTTTATQGGRGGRSRKTTQSANASGSTQETTRPVAGTAETSPVVQDTDSTPTSRQPSATPTSDGGNGQTVQTPKYTGLTDTPTKGTADGSGVTGAKTAERSADGERTTSPTETELELYKSAITKLSNKDYGVLVDFARRLKTLNSDDATLDANDVVYAIVNIERTEPSERASRISWVLLDTGYTPADVQARTKAMLDVFAKVMANYGNYDSNEQAPLPSDEPSAMVDATVENPNNTRLTKAVYTDLDENGRVVRRTETQYVPNERIRTADGRTLAEVRQAEQPTEQAEQPLETAQLSEHLSDSTLGNTLDTVVGADVTMRGVDGTVVKRGSEYVFIAYDSDTQRVLGNTGTPRTLSDVGITAVRSRRVIPNERVQRAINMAGREQSAIWADIYDAINQPSTDTVMTQEQVELLERAITEPHNTDELADAIDLLALQFNGDRDKAMDFLEQQLDHAEAMYDYVDNNDYEGAINHILGVASELEYKQLMDDYSTAIDLAYQTAEVNGEVDLLQSAILEQIDSQISIHDRIGVLLAYADNAEPSPAMQSTVEQLRINYTLTTDSADISKVIADLTADPSTRKVKHLSAKSKTIADRQKALKQKIVSKSFSGKMSDRVSQYIDAHDMAVKLTIGSNTKIGALVKQGNSVMFLADDGTGTPIELPTPHSSTTFNTWNIANAAYRLEPALPLYLTHDFISHKVANYATQTVKTPNRSRFSEITSTQRETETITQASDSRTSQTIKKLQAKKSTSKKDTPKEPTAEVGADPATPETTATEPKSKPKTKGKLTSTKDKPKTKRGTKNDEEAPTRQQTTAPRTDDETSESGSRADAKPSDEQSGTVREQGTSDDGKNQTAKPTDADVRQEAEVGKKLQAKKTEPKKVQLAANIESVYKVIDNVKLDATSNTVLTTLVNRDKKASNPNTKREIMTDLAVASATNDTTVFEKYTKQYVVDGERTSKKTKLERIKALADTLWDSVKALVVAVSISLAALTGTAMVAPVDAQASTTAYTQTDLSQQVKDTASHVVQTKDNGGKPFIVADKMSGNITLFDASGKVLTTAPALFGRELGDNLNSAEQRVTPAGRFELDYSEASDTKLYGSHLQRLRGTKMTGADGVEYVWAIHRVINQKGENRLNRLNSKTASDNRISNGCINVPAEFFNKHLNQQFDGVLYVLPETANFNGTMFNNSTVSDRASTTEQSGRSETSIGTTSGEKSNATTTESTTPTAEQIGNIGKHPLLTADDIKAANNRILGLPDEAPTPADEPARVGDNPSTQQAVIEAVTVDGKSHTTALVEQGQLTPAEERADTTFDTLPTTEKSSDGFSVSDIAIALGSLVGLGAGVVKLRRVRRNGKVEVEPVLDDTEANADTETVTETPTEPKSATGKLKSLMSRKKQPKSNRRVVTNDQDLVSQIRSELMALEDLQDNIAAQQLLYAMAGNSSELAVGFAANWNPLMRSINQALQDDTNAFESNSKTFSWRIDRKGTDDESKANGPISSLYNHYMQFSGGATPNFDRFLELTGGKRIGLMQDSFKLSASLAKINATRNALFGAFNTRVLKGIEKTMLDHEFNPEYAKRIKALGKKPSNGDIGYSIPHDFGMYATYMHAYHEAYDWQIKSMTNVAKHHQTEAEYAVEKALEVVRKYTDDDQVIKAIANLIESDRTDGEIEAGLRSYDISHNDLSHVKRFKRDYHESMTKADRQYELIDATQEYYENAKGVTGKTDYPLPIGMTKQDIEAKMKALEDLYGKDALEKTAKSIFRANELAVQESVMRGGYTSQELATIKAAGFKMYVPLHKAKSETDTSVGDVLETGYFDVYEESSREYRTMGLTPDLVRYHRKGMTSPPNDAYTNLLPFVQNQMGRAAESDFKYGIRELAEGTNPTIASLSAWKKDGVIEYTDTEGLIRIPASMRSDVLPEYLRNHVGVRMRGTTVVEVPHETERGKFVKKLVESDYIYYFTDIKVQNELTHVAQANDKLRRNFFTNNLYTIQRWQAALMTSKRPVWNFWNFFKEASERTITLMFRPVADADGNRISSRKLAATNIKNLAKLSSSMELQAEITDYIRYREVTTPLQRILAEMDDAGALQLYTSTVDRHNAMQDEVKSELDKFADYVGKNSKKLASKFKVSSKALSNAESLAEWYQVRLVETPQVVNALATYMTYKQLGVNKKEATNRTRDMFDPLRLNSPAVNKLASFFPFVRSILAGNYNTARTVDMITQDPKMAATAVLGVMSSVALLALALAALGEDDETGEPYAERLTFGDLSRGLPIRIGKDVFFIPMGFGLPNILWSMGAGMALGTINGVEPSEIISNTLMMALKNTVPVSPASGDENRSLTGVLLSIAPAMVRPVAEVMLNQRAFGGSAIVTARNVPEGYDKADVSAWGTPEAYKDMAKTLASVGLDMHPEQLRHLIQGYFLQGPLRAIDAALQDKGEKSGGVLMDKGETLGPLMTLAGADISYQTNRFSYRNAFYELQEKEKEILKKYDVTATRSGADTLDDVTEFAGMSGLDSSRIKQDDSNIARVRNELVKKGATLDEVQFIIDMNYAKLDYRNATSEAGKAATHYYRGVKSGETSDKTAPSVYQEQFLMAELEMNHFVKKYLRLLSED